MKLSAVAVAVCVLAGVSLAYHKPENVREERSELSELEQAGGKRQERILGAIGAAARIGVAVARAGAPAAAAASRTAVATGARAAARGAGTAARGGARAAARGGSRGGSRGAGGARSGARLANKAKNKASKAKDPENEGTEEQSSTAEGGKKKPELVNQSAVAQNFEVE